MTNDLERKKALIADHNARMRQMKIDSEAESAQLIADLCNEAIAVGTSGTLTIDEARKRLAEAE